MVTAKEDDHKMEIIWREEQPNDGQKMSGLVFAKHFTVMYLQPQELVSSGRQTQGTRCFDLQVNNNFTASEQADRRWERSASLLQQQPET